MKKKIFAFIAIISLLLSFIVRAEVSHKAEEVKAGSFGEGFS